MKVRTFLALLVCGVMGIGLALPGMASAARYVVENWNPSTGDWHANPNLDFIGWEQFNEDPELLSLHQDGSQGHGLYGHSDLSALSNGAVAEWHYTPPGTSTVFKSEYEEATFNLAGCLNEGMRLKSGEWENTVNEGPPYQEQHRSYHPTACGAGVVNFPVEGQLIVGNPGPQIFCAKEGEPNPCGLYNSPLENSAAFGIERFGLIQTPFSAYLRGIRVYETSYVKPHFTGATNTVEGWVHTGTGTITPSATETGMGMKTIRLTSLKRAGGTEEKSQSSPCTGTRLARCPATWNKAEPAYSPSFPYSVDELPEGIDHFGVKAVDIVENESLPEGGPDETVVPPTKVDRTPPANVTASGELFELANQYIAGQGTKTVGVSATDNLSGIRSLSLEDEGHGVLASYTPPSCIFTPLREDQCPLEASETLSVDTGQMPEGANHLRVVAEDLAGNVGYSSSWTVFVDRTAPGVASDLEATYQPEENGVAVTWIAAPDPPLADGTPGSGANVEEYRYRVNGGPWSAVGTTQTSEFLIPGAADGSTITAEITTDDLVGNRGASVVLSTIAGEATGSLEDPGEPSGESLEGIGFSTAPSPIDHKGEEVIQAATQDVPITPAAAYEEKNCPGGELSCGTYNGREAAKYARYWYSRRNGAYEDFENDCTNFVSQAMLAGGMRFIRTGGHTDPEPPSSVFFQYYKKDYGSWWSAHFPEASLTFWTESWTVAWKSHNRLFEHELADLLGPKAVLKPGDIIYYRFPEHLTPGGEFPAGEPWTHSAIVTRNTPKGPWVAQHTRDYERQLSDVFAYLRKEFGKEGVGWLVQAVRPTRTAYNLP